MYNKDVRNMAENLLLDGFSTNDVSNKTGVSIRVIQRWRRELVNKNQSEIKSDKSEYDLSGCKWLKKPDKPGIIGVIGDLHLPFENKNYLKFLITTFKKYNVDTIVNIGDTVDFSTFSRHISEADALGPNDEINIVREKLKDYYEIFPYMYCCLGNHPKRLMQRASDSGLPSVCIKSLEELFNIPETWIIEEMWELNGVLFTHGSQFNSRNILSTLSGYSDKSICIGHNHSLLGVIYNKNLFNKNSFAMCVGCGIDDSAYSFRYGRNNKMKPVLGCGVVISSDEAYTIRMEE